MNGMSNRLQTKWCVDVVLSSLVWIHLPILTAALPDNFCINSELICAGTLQNADDTLALAQSTTPTPFVKSPTQNSWSSTVCDKQNRPKKPSKSGWTTGPTHHSAFHWRRAEVQSVRTKIDSQGHVHLKVAVRKFLALHPSDRDKTA